MNSLNFEAIKFAPSTVEIGNFKILLTYYHLFYLKSLISKGIFADHKKT